MGIKTAPNPPWFDGYLLIFLLECGKVWRSYIYESLNDTDRDQPPPGPLSHREDMEGLSKDGFERVGLGWGRSSNVLWADRVLLGPGRAATGEPSVSPPGFLVRLTTGYYQAGHENQRRVTPFTCSPVINVSTFLHVSQCPNLSSLTSSSLGPSLQSPLRHIWWLYLLSFPSLKKWCSKMVQPAQISLGCFGIIHFVHEKHSVGDDRDLERRANQAKVIAVCRPCSRLLSPWPSPGLKGYLYLCGFQPSDIQIYPQSPYSTFYHSVFLSLFVSLVLSSSVFLFSFLSSR